MLDLGRCSTADVCDRQHRVGTTKREAQRKSPHIADKYSRGTSRRFRCRFRIERPSYISEGLLLPNRRNSRLYVGSMRIFQLLEDFKGDCPMLQSILVIAQVTSSCTQRKQDKSFAAAIVKLSEDHKSFPEITFGS